MIPLKRPFILAASVFALAFGAFGAPIEIRSPDERIAVEVSLNDQGAPRYRVKRSDLTVLQDSKLGLVRDDADFSMGLTLVGASTSEKVSDQYEILTAKRRVNTYAANRRVVTLRTQAGQAMEIVFQVSNDGVAFRYNFPEKSSEVRRIKEEVTSFHFLEGTLAWLQPMSVARTGWKETNPSYEEFYMKKIPVGTPSPLAGWVFPALFSSDGVWMLVSEAGLGRNYCGSRLRPTSPDGEYTIGFPDMREGFKDRPVLPESTLPWSTPWRFIVIGELSTIVESTLGTSLADPPAVAFDAKNVPGKASWSWPLMGDRATTFDVQKRFVDYAADMRWKYCLVDALWDTQIGYEKMEELVKYARSKNVSILVWYNSAGDWCGAPQTPRGMMLTHESRDREFARLKAMGVAGVKVDFFGGDGQSMIAYYHDILVDAAKHGLSVNFHGATLPRGWHRTYPNLMTAEAIKGLEYITFEQKNADQEPTHAAMLPFTRNVFDPMDFTPMVLDKIPRIQRRTTRGFELALSILFTSGIQHYAEIPEGMATAPDYVRDFIRDIPSIWDDTVFLEGVPGEYVVLARRSKGVWYVAGINATDKTRNLFVNIGRVNPSHMRGSVDVITTGAKDHPEFRKVLTPVRGMTIMVDVPPNGGFVTKLLTAVR